MASANANLHKAKDAKNDEFYTQLTDVAKELMHYKAHFKDKCPFCVKNGIDTEYAYNEMQGDHIIPWSQGGRTIDSNLQMLCQKCNNDKSNQ